MGAGDAYQSRWRVPLLPRRGAADDRAEIRPHRQHRIDRRQRRQSECVGLFGVTGRRDRADQVPRQGAGGSRHRRECHHAGRREDCDLRPDDQGAHRLHALEDPPRALREGRGSGGAGRVVRLGGQLVHHRRGVRHFGRAGGVLTPQEKAQRDRLTAIGLMCFAVFLFAGNDATAKYLNGHMHTVQVVWARYMSAFVLALVMSNPFRRPEIMRTQRPWLQLGRSTLLLFSTVLNFIALRYLQLDQAVAIIFCTPFIVAALGGPILGEWIGWRRWIAILVGFAGVLLVTRPGAGGIHPAALLVAGSAICYAIYSITTRGLARHDGDAP